MLYWWSNCLILICSNTVDNISFLDLKIKIINVSWFISLYDKRNDFHFKVNCLINWFSCIGRKVLKNILFSQVKKIHKICNNNEDLKIVLKNLKKILLVNCYPSHLIYECFLLASFRYSFCLGKIDVLVSCPISRKGFAFLLGGLCYCRLYSLFHFHFGLFGILSVFKFLCIV